MLRITIRQNMSNFANSTNLKLWQKHILDQCLADYHHIVSTLYNTKYTNNTKICMKNDKSVDISQASQANYTEMQMNEQNMLKSHGYDCIAYAKPAICSILITLYSCS